MRDLCVWTTAFLLLVAAMFTVSVRRDVFAEGRRIGALQQRLRELRRRNDNLALEREHLASPGTLRERAVRAGLAPEAPR